MKKCTVLLTREHCLNTCSKLKSCSRIANNQTAKNGYPNSIKIKEKYAILKVYSKTGNLKAKSKIDFSDVPLVIRFRWYLHKSGYLYNDNVGFLHNCIYFKFLKNTNFIVDHKDTNRLNNRRINLRSGTYSDNNRNRKILRSNTTGVIGVSLFRDKYQVGISINNKRKYIGVFTDILKAAEAYNLAAVKYGGKFARVNDLKLLKLTLKKV